MLRGLRDAAAFEKSAETVKRARRDRQRGIGRAVLIVLRNGSSAGLVEQRDLHRFFALIGNVGRGHHVGPIDVAPPFVPMTVAVFLEAGIGDEVAVETGEDWKRRG
jgi:hypothetical protein